MWVYVRVPCVVYTQMVVVREYRNGNGLISIPVLSEKYFSLQIVKWFLVLQNVNELIQLCSGFWVGGFGFVFYSCKPNLGEKARKTSCTDGKKKKRNQFRPFCHWNFFEQWMKSTYQQRMETCMHTNFLKFWKEDLIWRSHDLLPFLFFLLTKTFSYAFNSFYNWK